MRRNPQVLLYTIALAIEELVLYDGTISNFLSNVCTGPAIPAIGIIVATLFFRRRAVTIARQLVTADRKHYDAEWVNLLKAVGPAEEAALRAQDQALRDACRRSAGFDAKAIARGDGRPRQLNRLGVDKESTALVGKCRSVDPERPVWGARQCFLCISLSQFVFDIAKVLECHSA